MCVCVCVCKLLQRNYSLLEFLQTYRLCKHSHYLTLFSFSFPLCHSLFLSLSVYSCLSLSLFTPVFLSLCFLLSFSLSISSCLSLSLFAPAFQSSKAVSLDCPSGWTHYRKRCYILGPGVASWSSAQQACSVMYVLHRSSQHIHYCQNTNVSNVAIAIHF